MPAKLVAHGDDRPRPVLRLIARGEELHHRLRDHRHRHLHAHGVGDEPVHLARVLDVRGGLEELRVVGVRLSE
jgi:hypothetical protein